MATGHCYFKRLAHLGLVLNTRARRQAKGNRAVQACATGAHCCWCVDSLIFKHERSLTEMNLTAATQSALAAAGIERVPVRGQHVR